MASLNDIRSKYLKFFEERGHTVIPSDSLVPKNDPTTLFTGSGMQPLMPYLLGKDHPEGSRVTDSQKCFRAMDIEEVGDNRHTTFFEMLGNWSLGDYFKKEQLPWFWEFLTKELGLDPNRIYVTCYIGNPEAGVPKDTESGAIWKGLFAQAGIEAKEVDIGDESEGYEKGEQGGRIFYYADKNWWSRVGGPSKMTVGEPGGPDSEVFYIFPDVEHDEKWGKQCHPNCDCGRYIELGNSVFMEYIKTENGFEKLPKQNVDYGGGLERITAAVNDSPDVFPSAHAPILSFLEATSGKKYEDNAYAFRVIADHMKAAVFLIADGVLPSNTDQGYFVRRLIRRSVRYADQLGITESGLSQVVHPIAEMYKGLYTEIENNAADIEKAIAEEEARFRATLARGLKELTKMAQGVWGEYDNHGEEIDSEGMDITGRNLFELYSTYGFPFEMSIEELQKVLKELHSQDYAQDQDMTEERIESLKVEFDKEMAQHQDLSRAGSEQKFKGGLADASEATTRLHTAHHLLLKALQIVLGDHVKQRGSNITGERLRIDFVHGEKMTDEQKQEVERIVNEQMQAHLPVIRSVLPKEEAEKLGAEHEFGAKYPDMVSVYSVGPKDATEENPQFDKAFSIEFCGGPHVTNTEEIAKGGTFKIKKEEASSAGIRRIKAVLV